MLTNSLNLYLICPFILLQLHLLVHTLLLLGVLITLLWTAGLLLYTIGVGIYVGLQVHSERHTSLCPFYSRIA